MPAQASGTDEQKLWSACPYFGRNSRDKTLWKMILLHLSCQKVPGNTSSNPYLDEIGFHVSYFEILHVEEASRYGRQWPVGELFNDREFEEHSRSEPSFVRRSSFTVS
jgi:hypothetical protein